MTYAMQYAPTSHFPSWSGYSSSPDSFYFYSLMSVKQIPLTLTPGLNIFNYSNVANCGISLTLPHLNISLVVQTITQQGTVNPPNPHPQCVSVTLRNHN